MFYDSHLSTLMRLSCANLNFSHLTFFIYFWVAIPSFPLNRKHLFGCQLALPMGSMMLLRRNNKTKRKHKCWIRGIFLRRREHDQFYALFQEPKFDDRTLHHTTHHVCFFFAKRRQALTLSLIEHYITRVSRWTIVCRRYYADQLRHTFPSEVS